MQRRREMQHKQVGPQDMCLHSRGQRQGWRVQETTGGQMQWLHEMQRRWGQDVGLSGAAAGLRCRPGV